MPGPLLDLTVAQPPAPNPIQTIGALANLRGLQSEIALRNAQIATQQADQADIQAQADQRARDLADRRKMQDLYSNGNGSMSGMDFAKSVAQWDGKSAFPLDGLISPDAADIAKKNVLEHQKQGLALSGEQQAQNAIKFEHVERTLKGILFDPSDPSKQADDATVLANAPGAFGQLVKDGDLDPKNVPDLTKADAIRNFAAFTGHASGLNQYALNNRKTNQEIATGAATAAADNAAAADKNASANRTNALLPGEIAAQGTKNEVDAADAAFRQAHGGLSANEYALNQIGKGNLSVAQAKQALEGKEFQAKYGDAASRAAFTNSVKQDPDSYFSLSPEMKVGVAHDLVAQGLNVPVQLPSDLKTRAVSADLGLQAIAKIRQLIQDPDLASSLGPVAGRLGNAEQSIGDTYFGQGSVQAAKEQELRTSFAYLKLLEAKGLLGGRPASQLVDQLSNVTANPKMSADLINGSLGAMSTNLGNVKQEAKNYAFGGASNLSPDGGGLPAAAKAQLREGQDTTFGNGQVWTLTNGKETRVK